VRKVGHYPSSKSLLVVEEQWQDCQCTTSNEESITNQKEHVITHYNPLSKE